MINRRQTILGSLASAAVVAAGVGTMSGAVASVSDEALVKASHFMLPGLWVVFEDTPLWADIAVDYERRGLIVSTGLEYGKHEMAFAITEPSIRDGLYKTTYGRSLVQLRDEMLRRHGLTERFLEARAKAREERRQDDLLHEQQNRPLSKSIT